MTDREQLYTALRNADKAGDTKAAKRLAEYIRALPAESEHQVAEPKSAGDQVPGGGVAGNRNVGKKDTRPRSAFETVGGVVEPILATATGTAGALVGSLAGLAKGITGGKYGTAAGADEAEHTAAKVAQSMTYQPRTEAGAENTAKLADLVDKSGIGGLALPELNAAGHALGQAGGYARGAVLGKAAATNGAINAADAATAAATGPKLADLVRKPQQLAGVGAARAGKAVERAARAESLSVPIKLTEGQLTRERPQVTFESETAKRKEGAKLANHFEDQNARMHQNLDAMTDETGAQSVDTREVGRSVVSAVEAKKAAKKAVATDLYKKADAAGETAEHVDISKLAEWVAKNKGKDKVAPIISAIESELKQNSKVEGGRLDSLTLIQKPTRTTMTLGATEDLRQAIHKLAEPGTPNGVFGKEAQKLIDAATEDKGGPLYKQARRAWENYAKEFEDRGVISKLLRTKPGTQDRAVALEKVADHAILSPGTSTDDVRHLVRVLTAHPAGMDPAIVEAGQQAMRDLRGAVIDHIKNEITRNVNIDSTGRATASAAKINGIVSTLDRSGKLDVVFGKQDAQRIRDLRDVALDVYTKPSGAGNASGTANALISKLDQLATATSATPLVGKAMHWSAKQIEKAHVKGRVIRALNPKLSDLAGKGGN